jgi:hypothetical protein
MKPAAPKPRNPIARQLRVPQFRSASSAAAKPTAVRDAARPMTTPRAIEGAVPTALRAPPGSGPRRQAAPFGGPPGWRMAVATRTQVSCASDPHRQPSERSLQSCLGSPRLIQSHSSPRSFLRSTTDRAHPLRGPLRSFPNLALGGSPRLPREIEPLTAGLSDDCQTRHDCGATLERCNLSADPIGESGFPELPHAPAAVCGSRYEEPDHECCRVEDSHPVYEDRKG